jgi:hypothetical protein
MMKNFNKSIENRVIIRVWLDSGEKIGHASLQTHNYEGNNETKGFSDYGVYVSIYPTGRGVQLYDRIGKAYKTKTLQEDIKKYKKQKKKPVKVELYSLDIKTIEIEYKKLVDSGFNFSILGSSCLKDEKTHNCVGLVFHLLKIGGIEKLAENFGLINFTAGTIVSCSSLLLSYLISVYSSSTKATLIGKLGFLIGCLLSTISDIPDSVMSTLTFSCFSLFGAITGSTYGSFLGYMSVYFEAFPTHNLKLFIRNFRNPTETNLLPSYLGGKIIFSTAGKILNFLATRSFYLFMYTILAIPLFVAGYIGVRSGKIPRYILGAQYLIERKQNISWMLSGRKSNHIIYSVIAGLTICRFLNLIGNPFNSIIDTTFNLPYALHLLSLGSKFLKSAPFISDYCIYYINTMTDEKLTNKIIAIIGEECFDKRIERSVLSGAIFFGVGCAIASSIGLFSMNRTTLKLRKLLNLVLLTPSDLANIAKSAYITESSNYRKQLGTPYSFSNILKKISSPIYTASPLLSKMNQCHHSNNEAIHFETSRTWCRIL